MKIILGIIIGIVVSAFLIYIIIVNYLKKLADRKNQE